jgi:hypothetical protein
MVHLENNPAATHNHATANGGWGPHDVFEIGFPADLIWSPTLNAPSFNQTAYRTVTIGTFKINEPSRGVAYPGQQYIEPGDGHTTALWTWTIDF